MISEIIILILAIPAGFLIAYFAKDELKQGKRWFEFLILVSVFLGVLFFLLDRVYIVWTAGFIAIVSVVSLIRVKRS